MKLLLVLVFGTCALLPADAVAGSSSYEVVYSGMGPDHPFFFDAIFTVSTPLLPGGTLMIGADPSGPTPPGPGYTYCHPSGHLACGILTLTADNDGDVAVNATFLDLSPSNAVSVSPDVLSYTESGIDLLTPGEYQGSSAYGAFEEFDFASLVDAPEPSSWLLVLGGILLLSVRRYAAKLGCSLAMN